MAIKDNTMRIGSLEDAKKLIARSDSDKVSSNLDFYYGNHWQDTNGWAGPLPASYDSDYTIVAAGIERGFVSKNTIKEVVDRAVNGVLGKDPKFTLSYPDKRKTALVTEAETVVKAWMKNKDFKKNIQKALRHALLSGKSTLRLFIPPGLLNDGNVEVDPNNPLGLLYLDAPAPLSAGIVEDDSTRERVGVFIGRTVDDMGREKELAELTYLLPVANEDGQRYTEIALIPERGETESAQLDLNGKLLMFELELPRLVTEQIRSLQMFQNLNLTMMQRNSILGGFLERVILNGQMPGHYEEDPETGQQVYVRDEYAVGAGTVNAINGVPYVDENGQVRGYTSASISYRDPVKVDTFMQGSSIAYRGILEESQQLHALLSGDAITSGDSRRQALAAFQSSLRIPKQVVEMAVEWLIETVLACAGTFSGDPNKYKGITAKAECKLDLGPTATNEQDIIERLVRVGIIGLETARERLGVEDLEEEARRVEEGLEVVMRATQLLGANSQLDRGIDNRDKINTVEQGEDE